MFGCVLVILSLLLCARTRACTQGIQVPRPGQGAEKLTCTCLSLDVHASVFLFERMMCCVL